MTRCWRAPLKTQVPVKCAPVKTSQDHVFMFNVTKFVFSVCYSV